MMLEDKMVSVKIVHQNRRQYEEILGISLDGQDTIEIRQSDVLRTSRIKVECICDICNESFLRRRVDVNNRTLCSIKCRDRYTSGLNIEENRVDTLCDWCSKSIEVHASKLLHQDNIFCDRMCYSQHRKSFYRGKRIYNYQDIIVKCDNCLQEKKITQYQKKRNRNHFCSNSCYWEFRRDNFRELYYNPYKRGISPETKPERAVREWLEFYEIPFVQEAGMLRKYYADFFLPDSRTVIEVNGDYWHVNPDIYDITGKDRKKKTLSSQQREIVSSNRDSTKQRDIEEAGFTFIVVWESDLKNESIDRYMCNLLRGSVCKIKIPNDYTPNAIKMDEDIV